MGGQPWLSSSLIQSSSRTTYEPLRRKRLNCLGVSMCSLLGRLCTVTGRRVGGRGLLPGSVPSCGAEEGTQHRADNERMMIRNSSFQTCGEIQVGTSELDFGTRWPCQNHVLIFHLKIAHAVSIIQFSSVAQSCLTLCNLMGCSTPGFSVHHQLLELTQTHVHRISDAIQPSHPLSSPSPPTFNLSQHQGLF